MKRDLATGEEIDFVLRLVKQNLLDRMKKHGKLKFVSPAEAMGTLVEEYVEVQDAQRSNNLEHFLKEMMDITITGIWANISLLNRNILSNFPKPGDWEYRHEQQNQITNTDNLSILKVQSEILDQKILQRAQINDEIVEQLISVTKTSIEKLDTLIRLVENKVESLS